MMKAALLFLRLLFKCITGIIWNDVRREGSSESSHIEDDNDERGIMHRKEEEGSSKSSLIEDDNDERSIMKKSKEEDEGSSNVSISSKWSHIEDDILECILERLCLTDYLRTQAVCSSWRATVTKAIAHKCCLPSTDELPLVLLLQKYNTKVSLFDLSTEHVSNPIRLPIPNNHSCFGTVQGWMIITETCCISRTLFFLNPATGARVYLPSRLIKFPTPISKIVASSKPTDPHCVVVCLFDNSCSFAFSRISDKSWNLVEGDMEEGINFREVEILDGKVYALTDQMTSYILVYDLQEVPIKPKILGELPARPTPIRIRIVGNASYSYGNRISYLATDASRGELLLVCIFLNLIYAHKRVGRVNSVKEYVIPPQITACQVFKLDMENSSEARWVEVDNLGDRSLFVGKFKSLVVSTHGVDGPEELIRGNYVYFTISMHCARDDTDQWKGLQILRLCLTDRTMKYFTLETSSFHTRPYPIWFIPNLW